MPSSTHTLTSHSHRLNVYTLIATLITSLLIVATPAMAKPKKPVIMPLESARIDEHLTPSTMMGELLLSLDAGQQLLDSANRTRLYSAATEDEALTQTPVNIAPMLIRTIKKQEAPEAPDLTVTMDGSTPIAKVGTTDGLVQWPINSKISIESVHAIPHGDYVGSNKILLKMRETAEKATSHPVAVVATNEQLLYVHSMMREIFHMEGTETSATVRKFAYQTAFLPIDLGQITPEPLDRFQVVIEMVDSKVGPFKLRFPILWLLPMNDGQLDDSRFGFKIHMQLEQTGVGGIPGITRKQTYSPLGIVTRVRIEGGTAQVPAASTSPAAPAPQAAPTGDGQSAAAAQPGPTAPVASGSIVPGSEADPLLHRPAGPNDPSTWGATGSFGGGIGFEVVETDLGAAAPGSLSAWYRKYQIGFDSTPGAHLGSVLLRGRSPRDTNHHGFGLVVGSYFGSVGVGGRFLAHNYKVYWGLKMAHGFTLDVVFGQRKGLLISQNLSFRIDVGDGVFVLPGGFLNFGMVFPAADLDGQFYAQIGLQLKIAINGNTP
jgi:hypothetical protein